MWGTIFKILLGATAVGLVAYGTYKIHQKITAKRLQEEIEARLAEESEEAFKAMIKEKKANAVKVGVFDEEDEELGEMIVESTEGVDPNLRVGQEIMLNQ
jgi:hypothetical protein